jgi:hypothetical protein
VEEEMARDMVKQLLAHLRSIGMEPDILGILSQMGPFSKIYETTYTFGMAVERQQGMKVLFSLRNVCPYPGVPSLLPWAVNHITIFHLSRGKDNVSWLVMEDYDSVFSSDFGSPLKAAFDTVWARMLNLCNLGWATALRDIERAIFNLVPTRHNHTCLGEA